MTSPDNWAVSCVITGHLVAEIRRQEEFMTTDHAAFLREGREEMRKRNARWSEEALVETLPYALVQVTFPLR